jgi:hypothetical protein
MSIEQIYDIIVNINNPQTPYEKWYVDMWRRRFGDKVEVRERIFQTTFVEEAAAIGATIGYVWLDGTFQINKYRITFKNERDYILWILRWA